MCYRCINCKALFKCKEPVKTEYEDLESGETKIIIVPAEERCEEIFIEDFKCCEKNW